MVKWADGDRGCPRGALLKLRGHTQSAGPTDGLSPKYPASTTTTTSINRFFLVTLVKTIDLRMAGLVVLIAVVAVTKSQDHILQRRSPLVSLPLAHHAAHPPSSSHIQSTRELSHCVIFSSLLRALVMVTPPGG